MQRFQSNRLPSLAVNTLRSLLNLALAALPTILVLSAQAQSTARVYPATPGEPVSTQFAVSVNNQVSPVYLATVGTPVPPKMQQEQTGVASFTSFDISGTAQVTVTYVQPIQAVKILPRSSGIVLSTSGNQVTFAVAKPGQLTIEVNGDWSNSLHLFANAFETNVPSPKDPNVIYFAPGIYHLDKLRVRSGQTVYLAAGAVLYANPLTQGPLISLVGSNITLRGRGIIDGSRVPWHQGGLLHVFGNSIQVEGVTLRDAGTWTFHILNAQNVQVSNVKVLGWRLNADGIDIDSSQNVALSNSFFRTYDDLIAVKTNTDDGSYTANIHVSRCVLWNQVAHALTVGSELRAKVENVTFADSDIIHDKGRMALLAVYNGGPGSVKNVTFDDIRIEQAQRLMSLDIVQLANSKDAERGHIANVTFHDIAAPAQGRGGSNLALNGFDNNHDINGVLFENVKIAGAPVRMSDIQQNPYVEAVRVTQ